MSSAAGQPAERRSEVAATGGTTNLAEILERVLDKGIVIAGDIQVNLLDIELLTIKLRLIVASVDKAREMGINWWEHDPTLSAGAESRTIEERLNRLESRAGIEAPDVGSPQPERGRTRSRDRSGR